MGILDWDEIKYLTHLGKITITQFIEYSNYDQKKLMRIFEVINKSRDGYTLFIKRRKVRKQSDDTRTNNST